MYRDIQRRDVVRGLGIAGVAGLAGCTGNESTDDGSGNGAGGGVPDAVMIVGFPESGVQLFRDYYSEFASDTPDLDIIVPDGLMDADLPGEVDNDMNNVIGTQPSAGGPGADFFYQRVSGRLRRGTRRVHRPGLRRDGDQRAGGGRRRREHR